MSRKTSAVPAAAPTVLARDLTLRRFGRFGLWFVPVLTYVFLWVPILVLVLYSFNDS